MRKWLRSGIDCVRHKTHTHGKGNDKEITLRETYHLPNRLYLPSRRELICPYCTTMKFTILPIDKLLDSCIT